MAKITANQRFGTELFKTERHLSHLYFEPSMTKEAGYIKGLEMACMHSIDSLLKVMGTENDSGSVHEELPDFLPKTIQAELIEHYRTQANLSFYQNGRTGTLKQYVEVSKKAA